MQRLHTYPDIRAMFRRFLIATLTGVLAALAVAVFRHAMFLLEWLFLANQSGSLVNAAGALSPGDGHSRRHWVGWRRDYCFGDGNG
jgi:CIC family chloride channel protein